MSQTEKTQTATDVSIYSDGKGPPLDPKAGLLARGIAPVRSFSQQPLKLDQNAQVFVEVDGVQVYLSDQSDTVKKA